MAGLVILPPPNDPVAQAAVDAAYAVGAGVGAGGVPPVGGPSPPLVALPLALPSAIAPLAIWANKP